jgi:hypothetical protein
MQINGTMFIGTGSSGDRTKTVGVPKFGSFAISRYRERRPLRRFRRRLAVDPDPGIGPTASIEVNPTK